MPEYTYTDVIIDPDDPRLEIGGSYYRADYPKEVLYRANEDSIHIGTLECIEREDPMTPFVIKEGSILTNWACLIRKKVPEKRYIPFDLSKPEVRDNLRNRWIREKGASKAEYCIDSFILSYNQWTVMGVVADTLLGDYEFLDGTPCGEEVL